MQFWMKRFFLAFSLVLLCSSLSARDATPKTPPIEESPLSPLYRVGNRETGWNHGNASVKSHFLTNVQPVFTMRCVSCHGCYEGPCQLNLQSFDGILRGYNPIAIYAAKRVPYTKPTRMNDANSVNGWRALKFHAVATNSIEPSKEDHPDKYKESLLYRFLEAGKKNADGFDAVPHKKVPHDPDADYEKHKNGENTDHQCVATDAQFKANFAENNEWNVTTFEKFIAENRNGGMPYALPRIADTQHQMIEGWLKNESLAPSKSAMDELEAAANPKVIEKWETFFNQNTAQSRQSSRYIYEHVFTATIHFDENPGEYFELVRSATRTGPIKEIVTELPYEAAPKGVTIFYRLKKITRAIVQKTQNVWRLSDKKLTHLENQFTKSDWKVGRVPEPVYGSNNMFDYFSKIPATIRSQFMRENSRLIVGSMVQGTVCIGSRATYAIADHFWAFFLKPEFDPSVQSPTLGLDSGLVMGTAPQPWQPSTLAGKAVLAAADKISDWNIAAAKKLLSLFRDLGDIAKVGGTSDEGDDLLAESIVEMRKHGMTALEILQAVNHYAKSTERNQVYQAAFEAKLREILPKKKPGLGLDSLWTGDGDPVYATGASPNAWLNITRHGLSATVQFGPEGGDPQSIWVLSYSNFERLYYNLVAHFKVWGSITHKLATWRHMSYVRLEGEDLAISLLPPTQRKDVRHQFTSGLGALKDSLFFPLHANSGTPRPAVHPELQREKPQETVKAFVAEVRRRFAHVAEQGTVLPTPLSEAQKAFESQLNTLMSRSVRKTGEDFAQYFPSISYVRVADGNGGHWVYTLLADRGYNSHNLVLLQDQVRDTAEDTLSVFRGTVGAYPGVFFDLESNERDGFLKAVTAMRTPSDWKALLKDYAVARNRDAIWEFFDALHAWKGVLKPGNDPVEQGIVDMSQYLFF